MKRVTWALALVAAFALSERQADACTLENCSPGMPSACYNLYSFKWCQITYGSNPPYNHWTPVNSYNHTRYSTTAAWQNWNYPPNGPTNSLYLYTDGVNNSSHDIDYWEASTTDWWWGYTTFPGGVSGSCINRGAGQVQLNTYRISSDATWQLWVVEHETGHAFGLDHVCGCSQGRVMNPCTECSAPATLSYCDGQGANALYH